jgi:hypothetical protein
MSTARPLSSGRAARVLAAAALISGVAMATNSTTGPAAAAAPDSTKVSLIGDSTMAAMEWYSYDNDDADTVADNDIREIVGNSYDLAFSAESCRRLVNASCRGRFGTVPASTLPLMRGALSGNLGEALVIMAGYDDASTTSAVDQIMTEAENQGVSRVLWLTYRTGTAYVLPGGLPARDLYTSHNAELASAATRHPSLRILDWNAYTANAGSEWFAIDGIHLTSAGAVALATYIKGALDQQPIGRCRASAALTGQALDGSGQPATMQAPPTGYVPLTPVRVLDTRDPDRGGRDGKVGKGRTVSIDLDDKLPAGATNAVLSVTATDACLDGFLTIFACGPRPPTSNINYEVGRTTAGMAISALTDRTVCVYASTATDVAVDLVGAFAPSGSAFHPMTPTRWVDTRGAAVAVPQLTGARATGSQIEVPIRGVGGIPTAATGVWLNLTVAEPTGPTVLLAYPGPCGTAPLASTVNARASRNAASSTLVAIGANGSICILTYSGNSNIVIDVAGWFGPGAGGLLYQQRAPTRLLDTRLVSTTPTRTERAVAVAGVAVLNVVSTESADFGFVSARPCGTAATSSLVNSTPNENTANITAVAAGVNGSTCVQSSVAAHLVVDQVGAFVAAG